jgi:hypothetical protein
MIPNKLQFRKRIGELSAAGTILRIGEAPSGLALSEKQGIFVPERRTPSDRSGASTI